MAILQNLASNFNHAFTFRNSSVSKTVEEPQPEEPKWWKTGSVYQVWPASFKDSNGDGLGDIPGIISKLDYLQDLGVDIMWLSPMYASPQVDMGYDISNYEDVYPPYGTLGDMDDLIAGSHKRGMRLILDLVINHTSDQHAWFEESKKSRDNPKSDWYIWKDPKTGDDGSRQPPSNWGANFGGSAWEYVEARDQYYLHLFAPQQPDLNWENDDARKAIRKTSMHFWFDKGVDGFRVDTANLYSKVQTFPDGPMSSRNPLYGDASPYCSNGPRIHEFYQEIRKKTLDKYGDPMMVGELPGASYKQILDYISSDRRELSMVFDFSVVSLGGAFTLPPHEVHSYKLPELKKAFQLTQDLAADPKAWSTIFMENHDNPRSLSRHATNDPKYHDRAAKLLAMLLATLSGTLFLYQGQEIGMTNIPESWSPTDLRDISAIDYWKDMNRRFPKDKKLLQRAWRGIVACSRDNARTPVQWSAEPNAGFTTPEAVPWMRINKNYEDINVERQLGDDKSVHAFWKRMLEVRKRYAGMLREGMYSVHDVGNEQTFTFEKRTKGAAGRVALVVLNWSAVEAEFVLPRLEGGVVELELVVSNVDVVGARMAPWEGRVYVERCGDVGEGWVVVDGVGVGE